jgi:TolA-binding protein
MVTKQLSEAHKNQINGLLKQINEMKKRIADLELMKVDALMRVQQAGAELNNMTNQFPALYGVPNDAHIDVDRGVIQYADNSNADVPNPATPRPENTRRIHPAGGNREKE